MVGCDRQKLLPIEYKISMDKVVYLRGMDGLGSDKICKSRGSFIELLDKAFLSVLNNNEFTSSIAVQVISLAFNSRYCFTLSLAAAYNVFILILALSGNQDRKNSLDELIPSLVLNSKS